LPDGVVEDAVDGDFLGGSIRVQNVRRLPRRLLSMERHRTAEHEQS